ncbi:HEAT repeat domain-containing protein [Microbacterium sp. gxy059]|uniref:HEAT repeat domain-containing protein n=1 Tax=Microbacterium sp. gxy059 TaxID=2957199 RepID=UPI003D97E03D
MAGSLGAVWGARGLLHIGPPAHPGVVVAALDDDAWRVREMALKVLIRHELDDPAGRLADLTEDPVARVRAQALRALGVPPSDR